MNRYGRHGSGAWLRRHKRLRQRQAPTSLVTAKPFIPNVVINITVPAGVERVIVIMVGNADDFDETDMPENVQRLTSGAVEGSLESLGAQKMRTYGQNSVQTFLARIQIKYEHGLIYIDESDVREYASKRAIDAFQRYFILHWTKVMIFTHLQIYILKHL